jgi:hypothetical protein
MLICACLCLSPEPLGLTDLSYKCYLKGSSTTFSAKPSLPKRVA